MLSVPDELDLLMFFESEPIESTQEEGYYCYKLTDSRGVNVYFSFHKIEASVQVRLMLSDHELVIFSEEYAEKITIKTDALGEYLECIFKLCGIESKAEIHVRPEIKVCWYTFGSLSGSTW